MSAYRKTIRELVIGFSTTMEMVFKGFYTASHTQRARIHGNATEGIGTGGQDMLRRCGGHKFCQTPNDNVLITLSRLTLSKAKLRCMSRHQNLSMLNLRGIQKDYNLATSYYVVQRKISGFI